MPEPKTLPQPFAIESPSPASAAHAAWLDHTERLLSAFERSQPADSAPALGFILLAADYLWDQQPGRPDFARLDVPGLVEHCHVLLRAEGLAASCATTLAAFYTFLATTQEIDAQVAQTIAAELLGVPDALALRS